MLYEIPGWNQIKARLTQQSPHAVPSPQCMYMGLGDSVVCSGSPFSGTSPSHIEDRLYGATYIRPDKRVWRERPFGKITTTDAGELECHGMLAAKERKRRNRASNPSRQTDFKYHYYRNYLSPEKKKVWRTYIPASINK